MQHLQVHGATHTSNQDLLTRRNLCPVLFLNDARGKQSELLAIGVVLKPLSKVCGRLVEDWFISHSGLRLTLLVVDPCDVPTKYFETVPVLPSYRVS